MKQRNSITNYFTVGNLNDYINIINRSNINGKSKLTTDDLQVLDKSFNGERLSYTIEIFPDNKALVVFKCNNNLFLNIYK